MINPDSLLRHADQLAPSGRGRPRDVDLRRGISASYYAVFHDLTQLLTSHLIGSCHQEVQNEIRRSWSHGEISQLAERVVERAKVLESAPTAPVPRDLENLGPLLDVVAADTALVESLRLFNDLQEQRHFADYDHQISFAKWNLVQACRKARMARQRLRAASPAARESFFTLLAVRRAAFRRR